MQKSPSLEKSKEILALAVHKPHIQLSISYRNFEVKVAETQEEMSAALKLRKLCFFNQEGYDFDLFDCVADLLVLKDKDSNNKVVGTYRMIVDRNTACFYSESEFEMDFLNNTKDSRLEVGRACIHPDYRKGIALNLLWQGLGTYIGLLQPRWVFGCSSVDLENLDQAEVMRQYLLGTYLSSKAHRVFPRVQWTPINKTASAAELELVASLVPPLLKSYLKIGAVICGEPCFDKEFNTLDFFTLLDVQKIPENWKKRFGVE
jgi:putative hemolysin